jgi:hypothetical protein
MGKLMLTAGMSDTKAISSLYVVIVPCVGIWLASHRYTLLHEEEIFYS